MRNSTRSFAVLAFCAAFYSSASAADFYKGKQITLMVNYTAGGPTDTEARIVARFLPNFIPGHPNIIVENMGGAGGMVGANWLYAVAPKDGLTLGYLTSLAVAAASGAASLRFDPASLPLIASVEGDSVTYARSDLGGGLAAPSDIMSKSNFWVGGLTPDTQRDLLLRAQFDLLGLKYKYVTGYTGAAETRLALERNEIQASAESMPTYRSSIEPGLVQTGKAIPLWYNTSARFQQNGDPDAQGIKALPFEAFYRSVKGAPPDTVLWKMNSLLTEIASAFIRTINVPPGVPVEASATLRKAVVSMASDPDYQAAAKLAIKYVPRYAVGDQANQSYQRTLSIDPKMKAAIQEYVAKGVAMVGK